MATHSRKKYGSSSRSILGLALVSLMLGTVLGGAHHVKRKITILYNEQCTVPACQQPANTTSYNNLAHVIALGPNDTLHYLWSSIGSPGVLIVRTSNKANLTIDWDRLLGEEPGALFFTPSEDVFYSMALIFSRLIEYNDTTNSANLQKAFNNETLATYLGDIGWQDLETTLNETTHSGILASTEGRLGPNASLALKFSTHGSSGRSESLPHLQSTLNSSQVELVLDNLNLHYKQSRFAIELLVLHDQITDDNITLDKTESIDDEYTPSVFETFEIKIPSSSKQGSFTQWKPVTYNKIHKSLNNAIQTHNYGINRTSYYTPQWSIGHAYYSNASIVHRAGLNVSFGMSKDGFYRATNYTSWTLTVGYGAAPQDKISLTIIIVISLGLGIPLVLILFGGLAIGIKKKVTAKDNSLYESLPPTPGSINT